MVTLREALEAANTNTAVTDDVLAGSDTDTDIITFDQAALQAEAGAGNPLVIILGGSELTITDDIEIIGLGQDVLTIDANGASRVINIFSSGTGASLSGLTITGGNTTNNGGGILNNGTLTLTNSTVRDNTSQSRGGGISNSRALTLTNSTVSGNTARYGGGIYFTGIVMSKLISSTVRGNSAEIYGGGIYSFGLLWLANGVIVGNSSALSGGGICVNGGNTTLTNTTVTGNRTVGRGGGIERRGGVLKLENSIAALNEGDSDDDIHGPFSGIPNLIGQDPLFVRNPYAGDDGEWGTADDDYGDLRLTSGSTAIDAGEDLFAYSSYGVPLETDIRGFSRIHGPAVDIGAYEYHSTHYVVNSLSDVVADDGLVTLREALEAANTNSAVTADVAAGGEGVDRITFDLAALQAEAGVGNPLTIVLGGTELTISDDVEIVGPGQELLSIDANQASRVMYITDAETDASLSGLTITGGNSSNGGGGGIYNYESTVTLTNSTVSDNTAISYGGGIYNDLNGSVTLTSSTVSGNSARSGGGIENEGTLTLTDVVISGNSASVGGGIGNQDGTAIMADMAFWGNTARSGGAISNLDGLITLVNSSVTGNSAGRGGGIINFGIQAPDDSIVLNNTIVALNEADEEDNVYGAWSGSNNLIGIDPLFVRNPSAGDDGEWGTADDDYGDLRVTYASPARDAGDDALAVDADGVPLATDIRGYLRIYGPAVDIGAYEYIPENLYGDANLDGAVSLADLTIVSTNYGITEGATWSQGDFNGDGKVSLADITIVSSNFGFPWAPGDANKDGAVTLADLTIVASNYGITEGATWSQGDFNGDGAVTLGDLTIVSSNYGFDSAAEPAGSPAPVMASLQTQPQPIAAPIAAPVETVTVEPASQPVSQPVAPAEAEPETTSPTRPSAMAAYWQSQRSGGHNSQRSAMRLLSSGPKNQWLGDDSAEDDEVDLLMTPELQVL